MHRKHYFFIAILCVIYTSFFSCHKEVIETEPVDYRDKWVGEYEHFDQNGIKDGSIFITKVYDYDSRIWVKGMGVNMAPLIDRMGNITYGSDLQGCIYDDTLAILYWKTYYHFSKLELDVQCVKKKEK